MCTNDVYICRDRQSSLINCTLACSTLGYIPCQNYMDKLVCSTIAKKAYIKPSFIHNSNMKTTHNDFEQFLSKNQNIIITSKHLI